MDRELFSEMVGDDFVIVLEELEFGGFLHEAFDPYDSSELAIEIDFEEWSDVNAVMRLTSDKGLAASFSKIFDKKIVSLRLELV
jgi:hypothetical protein